MDIMDTIQNAFNGLNGDIQTILKIVNTSPESNGSIWAIITNIFNVILPVGYSLATLFFLQDFLNKSIMLDYMKWENVVKSLLKLIVAKFFMERSFELLGIIFGIVAGITASISAHPVQIKDIVDIATLKTQVEAMNLIDKIFFQMQFTPVTIFMMLIKTVIKVIVYGRMIELYIYTAVAPIPLATMTSESLHGIAKKFLQSYTGVCLQGLIIMISCLAYTGLVGDMVQPASGNGELSLNVWGFIMSSLVLLLVLLKSGSWSKAITGLM